MAFKLDSLNFGEVGIRNAKVTLKILIVYIKQLGWVTRVVILRDVVATRINILLLGVAVIPLVMVVGSSEFFKFTCFVAILG